jgi:hypothetical protein
MVPRRTVSGCLFPHVVLPLPEIFFGVQIGAEKVVGVCTPVRVPLCTARTNASVSIIG